MTIVVMRIAPAVMPAAYQRYLVNGMRDAFNMPGTPIRLWVRGGKNPFADKD